MSTNSLPATEQVEAAVARYSALLYQHSLVLLAHRQDAEDAVQETFLRYMRHAPSFRDAEHEKAWLLTVNTNLCKNIRRTRAMHPQEDLDALPDVAQPAAEPTPLLDALIRLPEKYKTVLLLHYAEGYKVREIAAMLRLTASAVKMRLQKGRQLLQQMQEEQEEENHE